VLAAATVVGTGPATAATTRDAKTAYHQVRCGGSAYSGAIFADLPRSWHVTHRTRRTCVWEAPDRKHRILLSWETAGIPASRAELKRRDDYAEGTWQRHPIWGIHHGRVWDYTLTTGAQRMRHRVVGVFGARISYVAVSGTYDTWARAFHRARASSFLAG
jgi:hypothetical protein